METKLQHILLPYGPDTNQYIRPGSGKTPKLKKQNRESHGALLKRKLNEAWIQAEDRLAVCQNERNGIYIEFKGEKGYELATKSLENMRPKNPESQIRLCNIREIDNITYATVYIPNEQRKNYFDKIEDYLYKETKNGNPKNLTLLNNINDIREAQNIDAFWQDSVDLIPTEKPEWCEIWLRDNNQNTKKNFDKLLSDQKINSKEKYLNFPERSVKLVEANKKQLLDLILLSDNIAEIRKAKFVASFWEKSPNNDQVDWENELLNRLEIDFDSKISVCMLDTGINYGHPLLKPVLKENNCLAVKEEWGIFDHDSHGTLMAGISEYGDLMSKLSNTNKITLKHHLESVKILPPRNHKDTPPELWGLITSQAISLAEIEAPNINRINCMAVTSEDINHYGRPSSWSGSIDQITSGATEENKPKRLLIISAGNVLDLKLISDYPKYQIDSSIHDPAQSWNALSVGAYTKFDEIQDKIFNHYSVIAMSGGLSPFSTTSSIWNDKWPIKPEIVMEGGNAAVSTDGFIESDCSDLSLLSTYHKITENQFYHFNMTSAATANAAWLGAKIASEYPNYWPETIRGLMVHSAEWTETLKRQFLPEKNLKVDRKKMLRICGYGVPDLNKALYSASNNSTIIAEREIQPYKLDDKRIKTKDMHLYDLPWPSDVLQEMPSNAEIKMRVTLSYFIEPSPGAVGWKNRYRYPSYSLKFLVKKPTESRKEFLKRVNDAAREDEEEYISSGGEADFWYFGSQTRHKGSIHSDIWLGTPQELANSNLIAVVPGSGWWKERKHLNKFNDKARYSLIISIITPEEAIDVYTPIISQIQIQTETQITI